MRFETIGEAMQSGETMVFGHRGASASAPMNTLAAFQLAYDQGADGIELDTRLSKDGRLFVLHDFTVDATTDGHGCAADMTLSQLKRLDAGSWFSSEFAGEGIPTLDEIFDSFGDALLINVEIKSTRNSIGRMEKALADCIRRHNLRERVIVSSFDPVILKRLSGMMPMVMMGFLYQPETPAEYCLALKSMQCEARHPRHDMVDAGYMNWSRAQGYHVNVWTVNDSRRACALKQLGVNSIITDDPARIVAALAEC